MKHKPFLVAIAAAALLVSAAQSAQADTSVGLEGGFSPPISFDGTQFTMLNGDAYDLSSYSTLFTFDLNLTFDSSSAVNTPLDPDGDLEIHGTFNGTYTIYDLSSNVISSGTANAQGDFFFYADSADYSNPEFTNGLLTQTAGPGLSIFPGATQFSFSGDANTDGGYFRGTLSAATSAVPLPASASMGFVLLLAMTPLMHRRRHMAVLNAQ
jgi:hypothetical protein